jgi:hypothetical protein
MSKHRPVQVRRLIRRLQPHLQKTATRRELRKACGIRHASQFDRWFPRRGPPPSEVRLTAVAALRALRWLGERRTRAKTRQYFVPLWPVVRRMGKAFIRSGFRPAIPILANYVGGGISRGQIYAYFTVGRRRPDGEFVLRFLRMVEWFWGFTRMGEVRDHPASFAINAVLSPERNAALKRQERRRCRYYFAVRVPNPPRPGRSPQTLSDVLTRMTKRPRVV